MKNFKHIINNLEPEHDYPAGLIHPYWARKPLNIIESIIKSFSHDGDIVLDPFMGSGTTVLASIKNNRKVIGSDLNPLSKLLVESIVNSASDSKRFQEVLDNAVNDWTKYAIDLYKIIPEKCIEREYFSVSGEYKDGNFKLIPLEAKVKPIKKNTVQGKIEFVKEYKFMSKINNQLLSVPINFSAINFVENSRIAIHRGVKASHFFTERNQSFINYVHTYIKKSKLTENEINFLRIFLSSMIPMLRLSDKKASSQWPYWRPKKELTSRNPIVALARRHKAFKKSLHWASEKLNQHNLNQALVQCAANEITDKINIMVDLIVTDPPYADHAPYIEYSELYWSLISPMGISKQLWAKEIVKTNAVGREEDSKSYENRLSESFVSFLKSLKVGGYFIFFYLDKNIDHWSGIKKALHVSNCITEEVIAISKQRRSMKTVTSPGKTLDGDLIIICKKIEAIPKCLPSCEMQTILDNINEETYFHRFGSFIKEYLTHDIVDRKEWKLNDISRFI